MLGGDPGHAARTRDVPSDQRFQVHHQGAPPAADPRRARPAEVDAALQETEASRGPRFAETRAVRSRFWLFVWGLNVAGVVVATIWAFQSSSRGYAGAAPIVLGFFLLMGLGISGLIGRSMLGRGVAVALIVPVVFTLLLRADAWPSLARRRHSVPTGTVELTINAPLRVPGSGPANCEVYPTYVNVYANDVGPIGDRVAGSHRRRQAMRPRAVRSLGIPSTTEHR